MSSEAPQLQGDALAAVTHRGTNLQIIASAGSGKTEVVSQRVAQLIADGEAPRSIVAITFTERAAAELKERVALRVEGLLGRQALDALTGLYVGTIHAYCFRILQQYAPRFETYDVLDDSRLTAFLCREANRLGIKSLDPRSGLFRAIATFRRGLDVVDNELLDPGVVEDPFRGVLRDFLETMERYRLLTYGQQIRRAVEGLASDPGMADGVRRDLRHLIVDEYQDVNPAQERLIQLLAGEKVELCVVGDDDQAIYQWRGSDVANIVKFADRYPGVTTFELTTNRRSRPGIIDAANAFAASIPGRIDKTMGPFRDSGGDKAAVWKWVADTEAEEAGWIADFIDRLNQAGVPYRDMAVLVRTSTAYGALMDTFRTFDIPVQPGGRTGLFDTDEGKLLAQVYCWLTGVDWAPGRGQRAQVDMDQLLPAIGDRFGIGRRDQRDLRRHLEGWKSRVPKEDRPANLVAEFYDLLKLLGVGEWDLDNPLLVNRLGSLARFSALVVDYEAVRRRARPDAGEPGEQVGGEDRGIWYYRNFAVFVVNYANGTYEGFDGEPDFDLDAVDLLTVHRAKGLEWPIVFVPSLTKKRFPSAKTGEQVDWLVPRDQFDAARYEGSDDDERRLFYVAGTRARDWLSVSRHARVTKQAVGESPYFAELKASELEPSRVKIPVDAEPRRVADAPAVTITYSELATFLDCGMAYRLRNRLGFQPPLAPELGYGKAVHHILRTVAERSRASGAVPDSADLDRILDDNFFLAAANKPAHKQMKESARRLISTYVDDYSDDLLRVWETEYPFELRLDGITVSGRADVILDEQGGETGALALVDYKTSTGGSSDPYDLQLQIYADAGRREGHDVRAAYVHDLKNADRLATDIGTPAIDAAEATVVEAGERLRAGDFAAKPAKRRCAACDVRAVCGKSAVG